MAALALPALGAAIGNFAIPAGFLGVSGAGIGWAIGGLLGSSLQTQRVEGPRLADLKLTSSAYGAPIPYVLGTVRGGGQIIWGSEKREISTTTSRRVKGGPKVKSTTYTYEVDVLIKLAANRMDGIRKIFVNGELQWTSADDADFGSINASTALASRITIYRGDPDQLPDPTYEAAVGIGNAPAYRGSLTVMLAGLQLGNAGQIPNLTFEMVQVSSESVQTSELANVASPGGSVGFVNAYSTNAYTTAAYQDRTLNVATSFRWTNITPTGVQFDPGYEVALGNANGYPVYGRSDRPVLVGADFVLNEGFRVNFIEERITQFFSFVGVARVYAILGDDLVAADSGSGGTYPLKRYSISSGQLPEAEIDTGRIVRSMAIVDELLYVHYLATNEALPQTIEVFNLSDLSSAGATIATPVGNGASEILEDEFGNILFLSESQLWIYEDSQWSLLLTIPTGYGAFPSTGTSDGNVNPYYLGETLYTTRRRTSPNGFITRVVWPAISSELIPMPDILDELCARVSIPSSAIDASSVASKSLRGYAITPSSTRQAIEVLAQAYQFEATCSDALRFVAIGGAPKKTISWEDFGTTQPGNQIAALPFNERNDIELPGFVTVKYMNGANDYQDGAERSARIATNSDAEQFMEFPIVLTPSEAKQCADFTANIIQASLTSVGPLSLQTKHSTLEPTDVVLATLDDGSTLRIRFGKTEWAEGIIKISEAVFDNASSIISSGATDEDYENTTTIRTPSIAFWEFGDWPLFRDVDDNIGYYWASTGDDPYPGAALLKGSDGLVFQQVSEMTDKTIIGYAINALADYAGGNVPDEASFILAEFVGGLPSSITYEEQLAQQSNAFMVGDECIIVREWTFVSGSTYRGTGLLRGRKGTEWAMGLHAVSDPVVLVQLSGIRRVADQLPDVGVPYFFRAVTFGLALDSAVSRVETNTGVSSKPWAPTSLDSNRDMLADTTTVFWNRRTRLSENWLLGLVPLGEEEQRWRVRRYTDNTYNTVAEEDDSVTSTSHTFNTDANPIYVGVSQWSARVGWGYELRGAI